jgi:hypothetical protein
MGYDELTTEVRKLLRAAFEARYRGELHVHKVRAHAYADGYMRALLDAGLLDQQESLRLVADARAELAAASPASEGIAAAS